MKMDDMGFYFLQRDIQDIMDKLKKLQSAYLKETGREFIDGQRINGLMQCPACGHFKPLPRHGA